MSSSVVIELDTTAPFIELGSTSINSALIISLPYQVNEAATISARLITTGGEIVGAVLPDQFQFDISSVGIASVQTIVIDLMDDVLNERQVSQPLVLRDFSRVLTYSIYANPEIIFDNELEDPRISYLPYANPQIVSEHMQEPIIESIVLKEDEIGDA